MYHLMRPSSLTAHTHKPAWNMVCNTPAASDKSFIIVASSVPPTENLYSTAYKKQLLALWQISILLFSKGVLLPNRQTLDLISFSCSEFGCLRVLYFPWADEGTSAQLILLVNLCGIQWSTEKWKILCKVFVLRERTEEIWNCQLLSQQQTETSVSHGGKICMFLYQSRSGLFICLWFSITTSFSRFT